MPDTIDFNFTPLRDSNPTFAMASRYHGAGRAAGTRAIKKAPEAKAPGALAVQQKSAVLGGESIRSVTNPNRVKNNSVNHFPLEQGD